jgi:O-antigen ligase
MRKVMLNNIIPVMKSNIITGIGTGGFSKLVTGGDFRIYPHNIFAELLLENGIFGLSVFGFFLFLVYKCFRILHLNVRLNSGENPYLYTAFLILIYSTLNAMVSGDIPVNEQIWFASGMLGGFYTKYQIDKKT